MSPHFFHSGGGFSNTVDVVASVGAGAVEEVFPQDKRTGNKQEIRSILLVRKRRLRTWREYDNGPTCWEPFAKFHTAVGSSWSFDGCEWSNNVFLPFPEAS